METNNVTQYRLLTLNPRCWLRTRCRSFEEYSIINTSTLNVQWLSTENIHATYAEFYTELTLKLNRKMEDVISKNQKVQMPEQDHFFPSSLPKSFAFFNFFYFSDGIGCSGLLYKLLLLL